jgi:hemoglobin-like flavoprotein
MTGNLADVTASLRRCLDRPEFVERFLGRLAERAPELATCINDEDQQSGIQVMARRCMTTVILAVAGSVSADEARRKFLECRTTGGPGMTPALYPVWAESLLDTLVEQDPEMNPDLARAWVRALRDGGQRLHLGERPPRAA